jgi:hypothetical protein
MRKVGLFLLLAAVAITFFGAEEASARPPYVKLFLTKNKAQIFADTKCSICHAKHPAKTGEKLSKKHRNEFGLALSEVLPKAEYDKLKRDKPALEKKFWASIAEVGKTKSKSGKAFAEKIKASELPSADHKEAVAKK